MPAGIKLKANGQYQIGGFSFATYQLAMDYAVSIGLVEAPSSPKAEIQSSKPPSSKQVATEDLPSCVKLSANGQYKVRGFSFATLPLAMDYAVSIGLVEAASAPKAGTQRSEQSSSKQVATEDLPSCIKLSANGQYKVRGFSFATLKLAVDYAVSVGLIEVDPSLELDNIASQPSTEASTDSALSSSEPSEQSGCEKQQDFIRWGREIIDAGGWVSVSQILNQIGPTYSGEINQLDLIKAADVLAGIGFGLAPDPRYMVRIPKEDESVFLFELDGDERSANLSEAYKAKILELTLGVFIAKADGSVTENERNRLIEQIAKASDLSEVERQYLEANLDWLLAVPVNIKCLRHPLKKTDDNQRMALRSMILDIALIDGLPKVEVVSALEEIYPLIGLNMSEIYSDLHAGGIVDAPVLVKEAEPPAPSEAIPEEKADLKSVSPLGLDRERIAALQFDTKVSSALLGENLSEDEGDDEEVIIAEESPLPDLNKKYAYFIRDVIKKDHWSDDEFNSLAAKHSLMASGVLEAVNEWSSEHYDEVLLDEYDGYDVTVEVAEALKTEFKKKGL